MIIYKLNSMLNLTFNQSLPVYSYGHMVDAKVYIARQFCIPKIGFVFIVNVYFNLLTNLKFNSNKNSRQVGNTAVY